MRGHAKASSAGSNQRQAKGLGRIGISCVCLLALLAFVGSSASSALAAVTAKGVNGFFGATGSLGGQLNTPRGTAVNQSNGNVYVADSSNNRISVFNSSGTFLRAFGQDVVESGPGNNGTGYEICVAANGDFCKAGITTASTGGAIQAPQGVALDASGNVYVSEQNKLRVQKFDANGNFLLAFGRNVVRSGPSNGSATAEVQSLQVATATGTFTLTFSGQTTGALAFNASASEVESALNALSSIEGVGGSVSVSGGPGDATASTPYLVTFGGTLNGVNVGLITIKQTGFSVGTTLSCATPTSATMKNFQWLRNGAPIGGATSNAYTTVPADEGASIQCQVFAINATAGITQVLNPQLIVSPAPATAPPTPPASIAAPTPTNPVAGTIETCAPGTWANSPTFTYQWYRNGVAIAGATSSTYTLVAADVPSVIQCAVTGTNAGGAATLVSANRNTSPAPSGIPSAATPTVVASFVTALTEGSSASEVCSAAAGDVCQAGVTGSAGGEFGTTFSGYLAIAPAGAPNAGNLLVADPGNSRVQEFTPNGAFVRAFGFEVETGGPVTFSVCTVAAQCKAGTAGSGSGQFAAATPTRVAEDAEGNIYTVEPTTNFRVQKFTLPLNVITPQGAFSAANLTGTSTTAPLDVAIDPQTKDVLVSKAFAAGATASCPGTGLASVAERRIVEISSAGALEGTHMGCNGINEVNGLVMRSSASTGDVYVASTTTASRLYVLNTPLNAPTVSFQGITGVSAHGATVSGFVNPNGPASLPYGIATSYYFAYKRSADSSFSKAPATLGEAGRGATNKLVSLGLPSLEAGTSYDVKLVAEKPFTGLAETALFSFNTPAAGAEVGVPSAMTSIVGDEIRATLNGLVTPNSQATTYHFEYGISTAYGTKTPVPDGSAGAGATDVPVARILTGLEPATTYHFRIVASGPAGSDASSDRTFTTPRLSAPGDCPNEALREGQGIAAQLPDCRAYELVSLADKGTAGLIEDSGLQPQVNSQVSPDGNAFIYPLLNGIDSSSSGGWLRMLTQRTPAGWQSSQLSPPSLIQPPSTAGTSTFISPGLVRYAAPDLGCSVVESFNPLTDDTPQLDVETGVRNLYLREADGGYELITNRIPLNPGLATTAVEYYQIIGGSADCRRVYFKTPYTFIAGASGLYEWDSGTLRDALVRPNGVSDVSGVPGGEVSTSNPNRQNVISTDGGRFFFTATSNEGGDFGKRAVFLREDGGARVVDVSQSKTSVATSGARYEGAAGNSEKVFFRANYGIATNGRSAGPTNQNCGVTPNNSTPPLEQEPCDLYAYDVQSGTLTDISVDLNPADPIGAAVQGTVAVDEDGSHVYFAALGQLVPGKGRTYAQNIAGSGSANVYLAHGGELTYAATLARSSEGVGGDLFNALIRRNGWTASTTPDGEKLLFESSLSLAGIDHTGHKAVYLYDAGTETTVCVSCRSDGQPSLARPDRPLLVRMVGNPDPLMSMSDDGRRVFFTSPDVLAPGAVPGEYDDPKLLSNFIRRTNIYEWEDGQVHLLARTRKISGSLTFYTLLGTTPSGDDVFLSTNESIAPQDTDSVVDVYDVRVDGGFAPAPSPPVPCDPAADQCQGSPAPQPGAPNMASSSFAGPGNPAVIPAKGKQHKKKHKAKKKRRNKAASRRSRNRADKHDRGGAK